MAAVKKFTRRAAYAQLRHIYRQDPHPSNKDIDPARRGLNYDLTPEHGCTAREYFDRRISQAYMLPRADVKPLFGWVITRPADMADEYERPFFEACVSFMACRYGERNIVAAVVHRDEAGLPHLHCLITPIVPDDKHIEGIKVCCAAVLTRRELQAFHKRLQWYLTYKARIPCNVNPKNTNGHGWEVDDVKAEREKVMEMFGGGIQREPWEVQR